MDQVGTAAGLGGIDVAHLEAEIIDHRPGAAGSVAGAEIAVDIGLGQPGVLKRALGDLGMKLCGGFIGCVPGRMLIDPGNVGLALDGQYGSPLAFRPSGFLACSAQPWQASKYSVRRDGLTPPRSAAAPAADWRDRRQAGRGAAWRPSPTFSLTGSVAPDAIGQRKQFDRGIERDRRERAEHGGDVLLVSRDQFAFEPAVGAVAEDIEGRATQAAQPRQHPEQRHHPGAERALARPARAHRCRRQAAAAPD